MDLVTEIKKIPPVTRFLCLSFFAVSISAFTGIVPFRWIPYTYDRAFNRFEIWRLYTSFFVGSPTINYIFEMAMLYRSSDQIESGPYLRRSADYAWQLFTASASIIVLSIPFQSGIYFRPLLHCLAYVSSALAPVGAQTSIFGLISLPIKYFPYILLGFELLNGGVGGVAQCLPGTVLGHLWWWGIWGSATGGGNGILEPWGRAPRWLSEWMREPPTAPAPAGTAQRGSANQGGGVHVIPPRQFVNSASASGGSGSGTSSGYNWGTGNRLGSE